MATQQTSRDPLKGGFILSEGKGTISRDQLVMDQNEDDGGAVSDFVQAGQVLAEGAGGAGTVKVWVAADGDTAAMGVLYDDVDTSPAAAADRRVVVMRRMCEVNQADVRFKDGSGPQQIAALAYLADTHMVVARTGV